MVFAGGCGGGDDSPTFPFGRPTTGGVSSGGGGYLWGTGGVPGPAWIGGSWATGGWTGLGGAPPTGGYWMNGGNQGTEGGMAGSGAFATGGVGYGGAGPRGGAIPEGGSEGAGRSPGGAAPDGGNENGGVAPTGGVSFGGAPSGGVSFGGAAPGGAAGGAPIDPCPLSLPRPGAACDTVGAECTYPACCGNVGTLVVVCVEDLGWLTDEARSEPCGSCPAVLPDAGAACSPFTCDDLVGDRALCTYLDDSCGRLDQAACRAGAWTISRGCPVDP